MSSRNVKVTGGKRPYPLSCSFRISPHSLHLLIEFLPEAAIIEVREDFGYLRVSPKPS